MGDPDITQMGDIRVRVILGPPQNRPLGTAPDSQVLNHPLLGCGFSTVFSHLCTGWDLGCRRKAHPGYHYRDIRGVP